MQNNKAVLFSTWGFNYIEPINIESKKMEIAIKDYLVNKDDEKNLEFKNAKSFAGVKLILTEKNTNDSMCVYAWVLQAKYYIKNNEIKEINSSSIPYKFILKKVDNKYNVIDSTIPRDGSYYYNDIKKIFPKNIINDINNINSNGTIDELKLDVAQQIKLYFHR